MKSYVKNILLIIVVAFNLRLGISSVPPVMNELKETLHISNFQASLLPSIPVFCMGLFAFFIGRFQQQFGRRKSIFCLLILMGLATLSRGVMPSYFVLVFSAFLIGLSVAIIGPLLSGFIKEEFPNQAGLLIGIYSLAMGLGSVFASSSSSKLAGVFDSWLPALALWGVIALVAAILWLLFSPQEKAVTFQSSHLPLKERQAWKMVLFFAIQSGMFYSLLTWITEFYRHDPELASRSVVLLTTFTIVQTTCSFLIPTFMDRIGQPIYWIYVCSGAMLVGTICFSMSHFVPAFLAMCLFAFGTGGFFPIAMLLPLVHTKTPKEASLWTGMTQAFGYMIGGQIPVLMGSLIDASGDFQILIYMVVLFSVLLAVLGWQMLKPVDV